MDSTDRLTAIFRDLEKIGSKLHRHSSKDSLSGSDVTGSSDNDGNETPLSHAEESAIEECLNDTEGSLSNVDLNIFDDISDDLPVHRTRKTRGQRTSERANMGFGKSGTDYESSSLDEGASRRSSLAENSLDNVTSMIGVTGKSNSPAKTDQTSTHSLSDVLSYIRGQKRARKTYSTKYSHSLSSKSNKRVVRRKRRNSPPINKNDRTHICSFFSAMADLVSTFPDEFQIKAKQYVNIILEEMLDKFKEWSRKEDPKNPKHDFDCNLVEFRLLQYKVMSLAQAIVR